MRVDRLQVGMGRKKSLTSDTDRHEAAAEWVGVGCRRLDFLKTGLDLTFLNCVTWLSGRCL